jgi:hypothetical protein
MLFVGLPRMFAVLSAHSRQAIEDSLKAETSEAIPGVGIVAA